MRRRQLVHKRVFHEESTTIWHSVSHRQPTAFCSRLEGHRWWFWRHRRPPRRQSRRHNRCTNFKSYGRPSKELSSKQLIEPKFFEDYRSDPTGRYIQNQEDFHIKIIDSSRDLHRKSVWQWWTDRNGYVGW